MTAAKGKAKPESVQMAREVKRRLAELGVQPEPPKGIDPGQWLRLWRRLSDEVVREVADEWKRRRQGQVVPDFTPLTPEQVAEPVDISVWRVRGLWSLGSHGTWAGPKKSFKTTLHDAMAVGVASGQKVMDTWEVVEPGPVLIYAGEGSIEWRKKSLQRIANDLYNVKIGSGDDQAQVHVVPTAYPFNTPEFRLSLAANIKAIRPAFVTLDSTYNYHPRGVNTADMYDRGPLFAELSSLVRDSDPDTSLMLIDHMRQAASLDLDAIAMAGVGQWVDSWVLALPEEANPETGQFKINLEIGSRRWGGRRRVAHVDLGAFDEQAETWSNAMSVAISDGEWGSGGKRSPRSNDKLDDAILQAVRDDDGLTKTELVKAIGGNAVQARERIDALTSQRLIEAIQRPRREGEREVKRLLFGVPASHKVAPTKQAKKASAQRSATRSRRGEQ